MPLPKLGGKSLPVWWFTGRPGNLAKIIEVLPYTGQFTQFYDCVLRLTAPRTHRGWLEMAYNSKNFVWEGRP